jgi:hypothetical protein
MTPTFQSHSFLPSSPCPFTLPFFCTSRLALSDNILLRGSRTHSFSSLSRSSDREASLSPYQLLTSVPFFRLGCQTVVHRILTDLSRVRLSQSTLFPSRLVSHSPSPLFGRYSHSGSNHLSYTGDTGDASQETGELQYSCSRSVLFTFIEWI